MPTPMHTPMPTPMHTLMHTAMHTPMHTHMHTSHAQSHAHSHAHPMHWRMHMRTHAHISTGPYEADPTRSMLMLHCPRGHAHGGTRNTHLQGAWWLAGRGPQQTLHGIASLRPFASHPDCALQTLSARRRVQTTRTVRAAAVSAVSAARLWGTMRFPSSVGGSCFRPEVMRVSVTCRGAERKKGDES
eukprot:350208-Chlamydomonas_euryale.AAC.2